MARQLATLSQPALGVALPISNVPGASGNTGLAQVLAGKPDGYTIAVYIADTLATIPTGLARHKHDDFEWIARTQVADSFLSVVMGVILGPMAEQYFLTSMVANANYLSVFVTRPVSAVILSLSALMVLWPTLKARRGVGGSGVPATPDPATQRIVD